MNVSIDPTVRSSLIEVLGAAIGTSDVRFASEPLPLRGGFWADLFVFSLADPPPGWPAELVARLMPDAQIAKREHSSRPLSPITDIPLRRSGPPAVSTVPSARHSW
jgi:hypothetical protein